MKRQTSGTASDNEWYNEGQRMTTSDNEWCNKWQRVMQRVTTKIAMSDSSGTTNENGTVHFKGWMIAVLSITKTLLL